MLIVDQRRDVLDYFLDGILTEVVWFKEEMSEVPGKLIRDFRLLLQRFPSFQMQFADSVTHLMLDGRLMEESCVLLSFFEPFERCFLVLVNSFLVTFPG